MESDFIQYAMLHSCHCLFQGSNYPKSGLWEPLQAGFFFFFLHLFWVMAFIEPIHQFCFEWVFCLSRDPRLASLKAEGLPLQVCEGKWEARYSSSWRGGQHPSFEKTTRLSPCASFLSWFCPGIRTGCWWPPAQWCSLPGARLCSWENQYYWLSLWVLQLAL